jgi:micrococcal nuclease
MLRSRWLFVLAILLLIFTACQPKAPADTSLLLSEGSPSDIPPAPSTETPLPTSTPVTPTATPDTSTPPESTATHTALPPDTATPSATQRAPAPASTAVTSTVDETAVVERIIDGDTIDVRIGNVGYRVRYIGVNTTERGDVCYQEGTAANAALVDRQTVRMVKDVSNTDRYGRLLRYSYAGDTFVNAALVQEGWVQVVE